MGTNHTLSLEVSQSKVSCSKYNQSLQVKYHFSSYKTEVQDCHIHTSKLDALPKQSYTSHFHNSSFPPFQPSPTPLIHCTPTSFNPFFATTSSALKLLRSTNSSPPISSFCRI